MFQQELLELIPISAFDDVKDCEENAETDDEGDTIEA